MMEDVGKVFADVGLAGVGLVALAAEQMGKAGKFLVEKGAAAVEEGRKHGAELQRKCQEEAQRRIPVGTPAVYRTGCRTLGDKLLCGKALDDRACFAVLLDAAEQLKDTALDVDLYILGSTQEETHSTGAITAAYGLAPDFCVAVDVTHGDSPDASKEKTFPLGKGPVIGLGPNCTKWMARRMEQRAREWELPVQYEVMAGSSGTNGWPMQIIREGIATAVLSVPLRYMHTPIETVHGDDLTNTAKLLAAFVRGLGEEAEAL